MSNASARQFSHASGREPETAPPVGVSDPPELVPPVSQDSVSAPFGPRARSSTGQRAVLVGLTVVIAVVLGFVAAVLLRNRTSTADGSLASRSAPPTTEETSAVMSVLAAQATALTTRDSAGWDAALDPTPAATGYRSHERAVYADLAGVPLTTWRYVLLAPVTSTDVLGPAASRLGGRVVVVHVQLQYAFSGVDPAPTSKDLWLTAVLRGRSWKLAADDDAAVAGGKSWSGPWDFGPLVVRRGPHTLVLAHPDHRDQMATFAALVEAAVPVVKSVWGGPWHEDVAVLLPSSQQEFAAVTADTSNTADLAAVSIADSVEPDGTVLGARIVLNPANLAKLDDHGRRLVIQHELTHIAARAVTNDRMPTWVIEGFADYVGNLGSTMSPAATARELADELAQGRMPSSLPSNADFAGTDGRLAQQYEESWLACVLIAHRVGQAGLVRFYKAVSAAAAADPATAADRGLRSVLGLSTARFTEAWRSELKTVLRE
ncbi:hypothetical protein M6D93_13130 [Jatrophihabitans telluris]|uniref:Peptidase MA-like domain-containing protein n=1 Tax=Jatrophihabitans telluris TaxID=2038343 RepID=A0ABY4QWR0_9ACTN|nr:hypothetical protein [Jatrophihabitans telluris]UQX87241.1 hypothetical protein M6D93_13130 [Jatrophihabitans telluris]